MVEAGDIFDLLEKKNIFLTYMSNKILSRHLGAIESGDMCKNSIKRGEAMTVEADDIFFFY